MPTVRCLDDQYHLFTSVAACRRAAGNRGFDCSRRREPGATPTLDRLERSRPDAGASSEWLDPHCLTAREGEINNLHSPEDWEKRQAEVRQTLDQILGPWPARSPLNARVTGILRKDGYRVEKVVFESMPGFHVTGAFLFPRGKSGRGPAILNVIGHSTQAFRRDIYQNVILNLVHKGFVVFTIDLEQLIHWCVRYR